MINDETLKNIENLHRLKTEGVITEDDFEKAKDKLLNGPSRPRPAVFPSHEQTVTAQHVDGDAIAWMILPLKRYFDFRGRSSRKEYWHFQIPFIVCMLLVMVLVPSSGDIDGLEPSTVLLGLIGSIGVLGGFIPQLAVQVRRFHDQDKSGWLTLLNLIPYVGWLIVLVLMAQRGTEGENSYGPDPLA